MVDLMLSFASAIIIFVCAFTVFFEPHIIGKERGPLTADDYLFHMFISFVMILLVGRVLGWW